MQTALREVCLALGEGHGIVSKLVLRVPRRRVRPGKTLQRLSNSHRHYESPLVSASGLFYCLIADAWASPSPPWYNSTAFEAGQDYKFARVEFSAPGSSKSTTNLPCVEIIWDKAGFGRLISSFAPSIEINAPKLLEAANNSVIFDCADYYT